MSDLISRQDAIDAIRASASKYTGFMEMEMYTDDDAVEAINGVPSAQQTIEAVPVVHGKWIQMNGHRYCNVCGHKDSPILTNYCPNCGAVMDGKEKSDEQIR